MDSIVDVAKDDMDVAWRVQDLYQRSKRHMDRRHEMWKKAFRLVHNRNWNTNREPGMPSPTASEVYPILAALVGWMTDQRTSFEIVPSADPHSRYAEFLSEMARDLETCMNSVWVSHQLDGQVERVLWDAFMYGTGFFKTYWDSGLDDGAGNATFARCDPLTIFPDPAGHDDEDINYIIEARRMALSEVERRWPDKAHLVADQVGISDELPSRDDPMLGAKAGRVPMANPGGVEGGQPRYSRPGQSRAGVSSLDPNEDASVVVYECWFKENVLFPPETEDGDPYYVPQWRVVVTCGNTVLMDEKAVDLWGHGRHPYTRYVLNELGEFWGVSLVDHLAPGQIAVNRLLAALQHHAELCGNPIFLEDTTSGINRTRIVNVPGQRVTKNAGSEVGWLTPPTMSPEVQQLVTFWINEMERISGLSAIVRGNSPGGRNSEGVMDSVQESAFVRVRAALRNLERFLSKTSRLMASLIVENYTMPRTLAIVGPDGQKSMMGLRGRHFYAPNAQGADPMKFSLWVQAGSSFPLSRTARAQEADTLFAMGALDIQGVLEAHMYPHRREILERIAAAQGAGMQVTGTGSRNRSR